MEGLPLISATVAIRRSGILKCLCVHVGDGSEGVEMSSGRIEQTVEVGTAEARRERVLKTGMMLK